MSHPVLALGMAAETQKIIFWALAVISVVAALGMVLAPRAVHCALLLALVMLSLAVFYALLGAPFLAFVQVIVYTGAVLMLFLFVLMIVGVTSRDSLVETIKGQRVAAGLVGIFLLVLLVLVVGHAAIGPASSSGAGYSNSNVQGIARLIFTTYVFPFEVTSALLITAALGAMVLAHRERTSPKLTQRALARLRVSGGRPQPLPGPGVYARHDAVDMPALLPDGTSSELSVSPVISGRPVPEPGERGPREIGPGQIGPGQIGTVQPVRNGALTPGAARRGPASQAAVDDGPDDRGANHGANGEGTGEAQW